MDDARSTPRLAWLFDIDGTLLLTEGAAREAFASAFHAHFGIEDDLRDIAFAGRVEPLILADILAKHRLEIADGDEACFWNQVFDRMRRLLGPNRGRLLPGVLPLLDTLALEPAWTLGLLTGNMTEMARIKLDHFGIFDRFAFGAFGEQAPDRNALARDAVARIGREQGLAPDRCIVVGDTEHDIACARAAGARVVAVATGGTRREALAEHGPDLLLDDLTDAPALVRWARGVGAGARPLRLALTLAPLLALLGAELAPGPAASLPLFSRERGLPCAQCHVAFPQLNAFGIAFRENGYRLESDHGAPTVNSHAFPLSLTGGAGYALTRADTAAAGTGARGHRTRHEFRRDALEIQSAGTLAGKLSYRFDAGYSTGVNALEVGPACLQLDDLVKRGALNLKAGRYDADLPYLSDSRRTTLRPYAAPVSLEARGVELSGVRSDWTWAAGLMDSPRDLARAHGGSFSHLPEDTYFLLMHGVGSQRVAARAWFDRQNSIWHDHTWLQHVQAMASASLTCGKLVIVPGYVFDRFDDRPAEGNHDKHHYGLIEVLAPLGARDRWVLTTRLEHEYRPATPTTREEDHQFGALDLAYAVSPNARLALEWGRTSDNFAGPRTNGLDAYFHVAY